LKDLSSGSEQLNSSVCLFPVCKAKISTPIRGIAAIHVESGSLQGPVLTDQVQCWLPAAPVDSEGNRKW